MTTVILFAALMLLLALSVPIGFSLALSALLYMALGGRIPSEIAVQRMISAADSFPLMALPFFILSGNIMQGGGISRRLIAFVDSLVGWLTGGLSIVTVLSCMFFGAISGSATATTAAIGSVMIPGMQRKGYDPTFAAAVTASSGLLGAVIPPSLMMVTYGTLTGVSVGALFIGGIVPGCILGLSLMVLSYFMCKKAGYASDSQFSLAQVWKTFKKSLLALAMPVIVLGGIYGGIFTPTEAAVVAVVYTLLVALFFYKEITLADIPKIFIDSGMVSGAIMLLVCTASLFGWMITMNRVPQKIAEIMLSLSDNYIVILLLINILLLIVGCFLESIAAQVILTPILFPLIVKLGVDPLHFGIIVCVNICIGTLTPPFGVCLFVASGLTGIPLERIAKKTMPFLAALLAILIILTYLPQVTLFLPNLVAGI